MYVRLLTGMLRPTELGPSQHPSALPFLWGCLLLLLLMSRSLAALCVLLLSLGDPAAGVWRAHCRRCAASSAAKRPRTQAEVEEEEEADDSEEEAHAQCVTVELSSGCRCSSTNNNMSKKCWRGSLFSMLVCAASVIPLALCFAWISHPSSAGLGRLVAAAAEWENPVRAAFNSTGLAYPWPTVLHAAADAAAVPDATEAAQVFLGWRLLAGEMHSWALLVILALGIGFVAATAEAITVKGMDDNLSMPLICMVCLAGVFGVYVYLRGLAGAVLGPQELKNMSSFNLLMLLLFAL